MLKKLFNWVFFGGLFLQIFVFWPWAEIAYEIPKVIFVYRWIEASVIIGVLTFNSKTRKDKLVLWLSVIFLLLAVTSSIFGVNPQKSYVGNYYRIDGLLTLIHYFVLFMVSAYIITKTDLKNLLRIISISSIFLSVLFIVYYLGSYTLQIWSSYFPDWQGTTGFTFGNPNFLAGFLVVTLPITQYFSSNLNGKWRYVFTLLQIIAILLTRAWAGVFGILLFITIEFGFIRNIKILRVLAAICAIVLLPFIVKLVIPDRGPDNTFVAESRQRIFMKGLIGWQQRPIFGWGWANFDYAFDAGIWPIKIDHDVYVDKAHSQILEVLVTTGATGIILYLALISRIFVNLRRSNSKYKTVLITTLILYLVHSQTNVISVSEEMIFWIIAGVSLWV